MAESITTDEKEILEELMNIAFGSASAELGEVIDIRVSLNVPEIYIINAENVPDFLEEAIENDEKPRIVEQNFWGDFLGKCFLVLSTGNEEDIITLTGRELTEEEKVPPYAEIKHNGILLEIGNILIGACIGKISEMLNTVVTYSEPAIKSQNSNFHTLLPDFEEPAMGAILLKTVFSFDEKDIDGFLLVITSPGSITWLKTAIAKFMENYG